MDLIKFNTVCPTCKKTRCVSRSMIHLIKTGINSGNCRSCSSIGNTHRYNKIYDKKLYNTPIYKSWSNMLNRCTNKNDKRYKDWGGRGIYVCNEWKYFINFYNDMSKTYKTSLTIDRIDNNGNYCKENCKWSTRTEQANNTRNIDRAIKIEYMGICDTISNWAKYIGIKRRTLSQRIINYHWSAEKALTTGGQFE